VSKDALTRYERRMQAYALPVVKVVPVKRQCKTALPVVKVVPVKRQCKTAMSRDQVREALWSIRRGMTTAKVAERNGVSATWLEKLLLRFYSRRAVRAAHVRGFERRLDVRRKNKL